MLNNEEIAQNHSDFGINENNRPLRNKLTLSKVVTKQMLKEAIDFDGRGCVVYGKGDKECRVCFDAKAKVHLKSYIDS